MSDPSQFKWYRTTVCIVTVYLTETAVRLISWIARSPNLLDRIREVDHDVVRHLDWVSGTPYVKVARADETEGYVHRDYLRALVDYRAYFEKREGEWKMITFIAGD